METIYIITYRNLYGSKNTIQCNDIDELNDALLGLKHDDIKHPVITTIII